jgi:putative PIN family toxin of toxin-antitoxin system
VFLDTNVLVSAFATRGLSADLFELVSAQHELITGRTVLKELEKVLRLKLKVPQPRCSEAVESIASDAASIVEEASAAACDADEDDRLVLGEAIAGNAEVFVTGDAALVALGTIGALRIVTPRQLWDLLQKQERA